MLHFKKAFNYENHVLFIDPCSHCYHGTDKPCKVSPLNSTYCISGDTWCSSTSEKSVNPSFPHEVCEARNEGKFVAIVKHHTLSYNK